MEAFALDMLNGIQGQVDKHPGPSRLAALLAILLFTYDALYALAVQYLKISF